ncbi:hypothetical protein TSUD_02750 [Trifolium subterraneum]|uniref:F-box domain-containing protein n=1 Tax=Trifolium subterraneum TaxID=3900 RepID=A0A2Z6M9Z4_TRISU|nr:hypothetical protein TSUD_02750 [Trifolium subterraneum]
MMQWLDYLDADIVPFHILPRLDGETLIVLSCVSTEFRNLIINNQDLMRKICISIWPSLLYRDGIACRIISRFPGSYCSFFSQAFPSIDYYHPFPPPPPRPVTTFVYAIDVFLQGRPFYRDLTMEQVDTTEYPSARKYDHLRKTFELQWYGWGDRKKFFHVKKEGCEEYLKQNMSFSCVVVETKTKCAGSLFHPSTCKPVSVLKETSPIAIDVVFKTFIPAPGLYMEMVKCEVKITCHWEDGKEDRFYMDTIHFTMDDMYGKQLTWWYGSLIISNVIENGVRRKINKKQT